MIKTNNYIYTLDIFTFKAFFSYFDFVFYVLITLVPLLLVIAFFTLTERKVMASVQRRKGPNVVGL